MGWGDSEGCAPVGHRQGDMGVGVLTTSQRLTARAEVERTAGALSDAVETWRRNPSTANAEAMCASHDAHKAARKGADIGSNEHPSDRGL